MEIDYLSQVFLGNSGLQSLIIISYRNFFYESDCLMAINRTRVKCDSFYILAEMYNMSCHKKTLLLRIEFLTQNFKIMKIKY